MTNAPGPYVDDYDRLQALRERIQIERLEDVGSGGGYVLHNSTWWRATGPDSPGGIGLEIAGPTYPLDPPTSTLVGPPDALVIYAQEGSGLQFCEGTLLDVLWPDYGLIYVKEALRRGVGSDPDEVVHGIFILRFDSEGDSYYVPADPESQPGVSSSWLLSPAQDLILDWRPVDVGDLLASMEGEDASV